MFAHVHVLNIISLIHVYMSCSPPPHDIYVVELPIYYPDYESISPME